MKRSLFLLLILAGCSPLRSSPNDEKHQLELTLHGIQTNLDDVKHDLNCFQTELQILDGRIQYFENTLASLKQNELEKRQAKIDQLISQVQQFEKQWATFEQAHSDSAKELQILSAHANETTAALAQFKERISELEGTNKLYKVKPGDSLEKIAKAHKTSVDKIKKLNELELDLIKTGQPLKMPNE